MKKPAIRPYDAAHYLNSEQDCALYLQAVMDDKDVDEKMIASALGDIARAKGMMQVAKDSGVTREALYRALSSSGNPSLGTILKVTKALGLKLSVHM